jgi:site-specific DNA recombinase
MRQTKNRPLKEPIHSRSKGHGTDGDRTDGCPLAEAPRAKRMSNAAPDGHGFGKHQDTAVAWHRISSAEQTKGFSIDSQVRLSRGYAREKRLHVLTEFSIVESAKESGRAKFEEMLDFFRTHSSCRILLVEKTDRLYRNFEDVVALDKLDLEVHFIKEGQVLSSSSSSSEKLVHGLKVLIAKNFIDNLKEETSKGMLEKARQGIWPSFAPAGYVNVRNEDGRSTIEPDPDRAPIIALLFERYASGSVSLVEMAKLARKLGLIRRGGRSYFSKSSLCRLLRNPIYKGEFVWLGQVFHGVHQPLVSPETWETVQLALAGRRNLKGRQLLHEFAFSKLVRCGHCGGFLTAQVHKGHVYYHCNGYHGKCSEPYVREEKLEEVFAIQLESLRVRKEILDWLEQDLSRYLKKESKLRAQERARMQSEQEKAEKCLEILYDDRVNGRISEWLYERKLPEYTNRLEELKAAIERQDSDKPLDIRKALSTLELARSVSESFSALPPSEKRKLLREALLNSSWKDGELTVQFQHPFDWIAYANTLHANEKVAGMSSSDLFGIWYRGRDLNPYRLIAH